MASGIRNFVGMGTSVSQSEGIMTIAGNHLTPSGSNRLSNQAWVLTLVFAGLPANRSRGLNDNSDHHFTPVVTENVIGTLIKPGYVCRS